MIFLGVVCDIGAGQYYCVECSKYFMNQDVLDKHKLSKSHKQRCKRLLKDKPWTTEDARVIGVDNGKPLGRAPKPVQFANSPALAYQGGAKPLAPSEAAAKEQLHDEMEDEVDDEPEESHDKSEEEENEEDEGEEDLVF